MYQFQVIKWRGWVELMGTVTVTVKRALSTDYSTAVQIAVEQRDKALSIQTNQNKTETR